MSSAGPNRFKRVIRFFASKRGYIFVRRKDPLNYKFKALCTVGVYLWTFGKHINSIFIEYLRPLFCCYVNRFVVNVIIYFLLRPGYSYLPNNFSLLYVIKWHTELFICQLNKFVDSVPVRWRDTLAVTQPLRFFIRHAICDRLLTRLFLFFVFRFCAVFRRQATIDTLHTSNKIYACRSLLDSKF